MLAAGTRPGFDPYGWLGWGKLLLHWRLDTNGAPSWKPLPFLFTVPYGLAGHGALWLWMVTSVAISLSGPVFAARLAYRLSGGAEHRLAGTIAAACAAIALLGIRDYSHFILSAQSDTMIVSLCLAAVDCQLAGRRRWSLWLWVLAALGRPEAWPFLGLYGIWCWRRHPELRRMIVAAALVVPVLWFGIPALTAKTWFVAGDNALHSPRELHGSKLYGTIDRLLDLHEAPIWVAALLATLLAGLRRRRSTLLLAAGVLVWLVVEIGFVLHGWPGVPRYLFEPAGMIAVLAGVFAGRMLAELSALARRLASPGAARLLAPVAAVAVLAALIAPLVPAAASRWRVERADLHHERARAAEFARLDTVVRRLGAGRILACAKINIPIGYQSVLAWYLGIKTGVLYVNRDAQLLHPVPLLNMYPLRHGWKVFPSHLDAAAKLRCQGLRLVMRN